MLLCGLTGHRLRFGADGATVRWECERGCGVAGHKRYASAELAERYARAFNRVDLDDLGRRPMLSLLPLMLIGRARRRA